MDLAGKAALVTGGGTGTGRAVVLELARRGCAVAVNYSRSHDDAEQTAAEARASGVRAISARADVADDSSVRRMVEEVAHQFGRLDVLINNAGVTSFINHADLDGVTDADWDKILGTNLKGTFHATRAVVPWMRKSGEGAIVNVSSVAGVYAIGSSIPYCASKAAINNMTVSLARALAPQIRVNAVAPGYIDTRWWKDFPAYESIKAMAVAQTLVGKACQAEDVVDTVLHLATADFLTGQVVVLDGGFGIAHGIPR